ncbi:glycerol dehydratase reactivase beta/small subunit family protein [Massilioclostridium coli]|uniref:glycerol dehydratase reactivase beta/small subunit family protein n=1 Tax=Massilioclostridium coli TaxID=1870991 RepID=UPI0022E1F652|nr:glycerol dehydratase reactivase beta/small subunit family protein [Massilioclostridium coli]
MVVKKPSILVYVNHPDETILKEVCAGIEEEGVLFTVEQQQQEDLQELSFEAAKNSMLGSGIGIVDDHIALQISNIAKSKNPFVFYHASKLQCRLIGANSARIVKKKPLKNL